MFFAVDVVVVAVAVDVAVDVVAVVVAVDVVVGFAVDVVDVDVVVVVACSCLYPNNLKGFGLLSSSVSLPLLSSGDSLL